ncbi:MAG: hypothetical protein J6B85_08875 [Lachnospiraceae bacterium]|nr:hypothetical protein [Lachnospiraceae bacterium]
MLILCYDSAPAFSPIPPDKPVRNGGAGPVIAFLLILVLLIAGAGAAAYLLL